MKKVQSININPSCLHMIKGSWEYDICAQVLPADADNKCVVWCSDNPYVASVIEELGYIYANHAGTAKIYATATDGSCVSGYCTVTVEDRVPVSSIKLNASRITLGKGEYWRARATVSPDNAYNKSVEWCSSNCYVADVDAYGFVTAKSVGTATIYATARDGSGVQGQCEITVRQTVTCGAEETPRSRVSVGAVSVPVDVYSGAHKLKHTVMQLFGGQNLSFEIRYDSTNLAMGDVGAGWYHNYEKHIELSGNTALVYMSPSVYSRYTAKSDCSCEFTCASPNKNGYVLTVDMSRSYPYVIDCNKQRTEYYDCEGRLAKVIDRYGFETSITYSDDLITITDLVSRKHIYVEKSNCCKITRVYDDASRQAYFAYINDALTIFTDVNGGIFRYTYDGIRRILSGTDPEGTIFFRNTYDSYGRLSKQQDGEGKNFIFSYACDTRRITDRNGKTSTQEFNDKGLLIKSTDANNCVTRYEYDSRYNVTKETDGRGFSTKTEYNSFNKPIKITDKNGNVTTFEYDAAGNVKKITYPSIAEKPSVERYEYNGRNQITKHTDLRGTVTVYTYDGAGMPKTKKVGDRRAIEYTYVNGLLISSKDARGNSTTYGHDWVGRVSTVTDAENKTTTYTYDNKGNVRTVTDANQKTVTTTYYKNGLRATFTDAKGNKTEYFYNGNMKNKSVKLPDNNWIKYAFDGEDRITKVIDQKENVSETSYDAGGRVKSRKAADGATVQYEYDKCGNVKKEINPMGAVVEMTYDKMGNLLTAKDSEGNVTTYEYNVRSKPVRVTAPNGAIICYEYNEAGDLVSETDAQNNKKTYKYDKYGNLLTVTDPRQNSTSYTYDANNNLLTVKNAMGEVTTYGYDTLNRCTSVTDPKERTVVYEYDALGRRVAVTDARGYRFETEYDANGNVLKTFDANGELLTDTTYNSLNLPQTFTDATGKSLTYEYNELGKLKKVSDAMGHDQTYGYDGCGRNTSVSEENYGTSSAEYDYLGNVKKLKGPNGATTSYTYDNRGRLISQSTTAGAKLEYQYNELSLRKQLTNGRGDKIRFLYDACGRISVYTTPEGAVSLDYDDNGNIVRTRDKQGSITRTFDALNRVTSCIDTYGKTVGYEYDEVGDLVKLTYPDNTYVSYEYDANHNLVKVTDWANRVTEYTYDKNNRVTGIVKPNGATVTTMYERNKVKKTVEKTASGVIITGFEYTYDNLSRIIEEKVLANSTKICYTYDELNRVTKRTIKDSSDVVLSEETFTYDLAGNLTDATGHCFAYGSNNKLVTFDGQGVTYDADGNMTFGNSTCCTYDSLNRLISAGAHDYTYNAENVRIRNKCDTHDTIYTYNTNCKLSQLLEKTTNGITTKYVYGLGLIGEEKQGCFKTYHFDSRGSTVALTDMGGNITDTFAYDTYGKCISHTGDSFIIFGYNGRDGVVTDKNGLIYMRARYYSPDMKRFINADIVAGTITNAATLNRYAYANANPVMFTDPMGLSVSSWLKNRVNDFREWTDGIDDIVSDWAEDTGDIAVEWAKDMVLSGGNRQKMQQSTGKAIAKHAVATGNAMADATMFTGAVIDEGIRYTATEIKNTAVDTAKAVTNWTNDNIVQPVKDAWNNSKIGQDVNNFDWNNTSEQTVLSSHYFSAYKGKLVIRTNIPRSGSLGALFISHEDDNAWDRINTIKHEYGHTKQLDKMGLVNYLIFIGLPSWQAWGTDSYYRKPWEITADIYGRVGLSSRTTDDPFTQNHIDSGYNYLDIASSDLPIWEKIQLLKAYY